MFFGGGIVTKPSQFTRAAILLCPIGLNTGCLSSQDASGLEPNDVAAAKSELLTQDAAKHPDVALASDNNWDVYDSSSLKSKAYLGKAQRVCANAASTADCPSGAVYYNFGGPGWAGRVDACDGKAQWVWAPGVTGASAPAELAQFYFVKHVSLTRRAASAQLHLAVDDQAEVIVNGVSMGTVGSTTDFGVAWASQLKPSSIDIANALVTGSNTITVRAANGSGTFSDCTNCTYAQNPAGVVFCIEVRY